MAQEFRKLEINQREDEKFNIIDEQKRDMIVEIIKRDYKIEEIDELINNAQSQSLDDQYRGYIGMRRLISVGKPPIDIFLEKNVIPCIINNIKGNNQLRLESLRILTFMASGNTIQSNKLISNGGMDFIIESLDSEIRSIELEAIWSIANILGDSVENRQACLRTGIIDTLIRLLERHLKQNYYDGYSSSIWALSNICRGKPLQSYEKVRTIVFIMIRVLNQVDFTDQEEMSQQVFWSICGFIDNHEVLERLLNEKSIYKLVEQLENGVKKIGFPTFVILFKLMEYNRTLAIKYLLKSEIENALLKFPISKNKYRKKDSILLITELLKGTEDQVRILLESENVIDSLIERLKDSQENRNLVCVALDEFLSFPNKEKVISIIIKKELIVSLLTVILQIDEQTIGVFLEMLYKMLVLGEHNKVNGNNLIKLELQRWLQVSVFSTFSQIKMAKISQLFFEKILRIEYFLRKDMQQET